MTKVYVGDQMVTTYFKWHYSRGIKEFFLILKNFLWFIAHFFSFELLTKTLFKPWKRMGERYGGDRFNLENIASTFIVNSLMRIVGFITRSTILFIGILSYLAILVIGSVIFIIWIFAPLVLVGTLVLAVTFFII